MVGRYVSLKIMGNALFNDTGVEMTWKKNWFKEIDLNKYDYIYVSGYSFEPPSDEVLLEEFSRLNEKTTIIFDPHQGLIK